MWRFIKQLVGFFSLLLLDLMRETVWVLWLGLWFVLGVIKKLCMISGSPPLMGVSSALL